MQVSRMTHNSFQAHESIHVTTIHGLNKSAHGLMLRDS